MNPATHNLYDNHVEKEIKWVSIVKEKHLNQSIA